MSRSCTSCAGGWGGAAGRGSVSCARPTAALSDEARASGWRWSPPTSDGFALAEADLAQRGAGDLFGTRQAGAPPLELARVEELAELLEIARREAAIGAGRRPGPGRTGARAARARRDGARRGPVRGRRRMSALWILAGIVGGALAGALDAGVAIAGGIGGMSVAKALRLIVLSASLLAFAGGLGGLAIAAGEALVRRTRHPARWAGALWTLAFAPLLIYDAFALFSGPKAAHIPAHGALSVAAVVLGPRGDPDRRRLSTFALGTRAPRPLSRRAGAGRRRRRSREPIRVAAPLRLVPRHAVGDDRRAVRSRGAAAPARGPAARRDGRRARGRRRAVRRRCSSCATVR